MELYKYTSIEHSLDSLIYGIYAGCIKDFNDPYEAEGIVFPEDYRVCCTSLSNKPMFMWAYYGNHRGCCIQFSVPDNMEIIKKEVNEAATINADSEDIVYKIKSLFNSQM